MGLFWTSCETVYIKCLVEGVTHSEQSINETLILLTYLFVIQLASKIIWDDLCKHKIQQKKIESERKKKLEIKIELLKLRHKMHS